MKIFQWLICASVASAIVPSMTLAQNCDSYRQQAQNARQQAAQEGSIQTQRDYHQAAAQAYRNAATQYDAKYQECLSGRSGGGGSVSPGYGGGNTGALQNFYNQMNQYQSQQADRQRREADHEELGNLRDQQGQDRAESERRRQLQDAQMQQEIGRLDQQEQSIERVNKMIEKNLPGLSPQQWADKFGNKSVGGAVTEEPCAASVLQFQGNGQATYTCTQTVKEAVQARKENKTVEFPAPGQRLTPMDWSKRFGTPSSPPTPSGSVPTPSPSVLLDPQPVVQQNPPAPDWSKRFGTSPVPATPEKESSEGEGSDPDTNAKQFLKDRVSSKIKSIMGTVSATADRVKQETSLTGMCQRARASSLYRKSYADLDPLDQRGIDVECAAAPVGDNATVRGRYDYGSGVVESGGKLLDEAGKEIANPSEP